MKDRHNIISDKEFWSHLEFYLSGYLETTIIDEHRGYWCDGFSPQTATNTKEGADIQGTAWIAKDSRSMDEFNFSASIPQKLLHKSIREYDLKVIFLDPEKKYLELEIQPPAEAQQNG